MVVLCLQSPTTLTDFYHDGVERREKTVVLSAKSVRVTEAGVVSDRRVGGKAKVMCTVYSDQFGQCGKRRRCAVF